MKAGKNSASIRTKLIRTVALLACLIMSLLPSFGHAQPSTAPKRVLVLYWYNKDFQANVKFDRSFQAVLQAAPAGTVEYYPEYLESDRFPGENQASLLHDYLRRKYADRTIDVAVTTADESLSFLLKYRNDLFPHTPIVFSAAQRPTAEQLSAGPGLTGLIFPKTDIRTVDLALRFHPGTEQMFIVSGTLEHDKRLERLARQELQGYESKVRFTYLTDLTPSELIAKTKSLPERSIILYVWQQSLNEQGKVLESADVLALFAQSASVPIYGMFSHNVGGGIIGGYVYTAEVTASRIAEIALQIANGARAQDIPVETTPTVSMFDWRQLRRWGISEDKLPPGSDVRFRQVTFWEQYKWHVIGVLSLCVVEALLILALLAQRIRRRRVEEALRENQERLARTEDFSLVMATHVGLDGRWLRVPPTLCELLGYTEEELRAGYFKDVTHPDDFEAEWNQCQRLIRGEIKSFDLEKRYLHQDGHNIWVYLNCSIVTDAKGKPVHFLTYIRDITRRKRAEEQLNLLQTITMDVAAAGDLASALEVVLRRVCERTGWVFGQVWFPRQDGTVLDCGPAWFGSASGLEKFRVASKEVTFPPGVGLPGRAWSSQHPAWVEDVTLDANFPRAAVAEEVGLKAALAIPILSRKGVIAVLEFFLREPQREDERLVKVIATIAAQLDLVIERKLAEEALRDSEEALRQSYERIEDLAGRLIVAQEAERKHLARELHDDLNQQIAALAIGLGKLERQLAGADGAVRAQITKLEDRVVRLSERIRQLSHELHSATLEHVGLAEALRLHCSEFAAQEGIAVDLEIRDNPGALSDDAALCLYRVAQESLRNIARHSGAKTAEVTLTSAGNLLELRVSDRGRGFDLKQAGRQSGLGLVSMQERVKLLHGSFEVRSQPGSGTELAVHLPLINSSDSGVNHGKSKSAAG